MISDLIGAYYEGIARKSGWEAPLADDMTFSSPTGVIEGKKAYVENNSRFLRAVKSATRQKTIIDRDTACVWMSYDFVSPRGAAMTQDVLEIWKAKDGLLASYAIYFDTAAFTAFMSQ
jgi:ketosteroid isomerase-like protein